MNKRPFQFRVHFDGRALIPDPRTLDYCRRELGEGEVILLERNEERSDASHGHQFAWLHDAWLNIPESMQAEYPTQDALRVKALIRTGWHHERHITCKSEEQAAEIAAFVQPLNQYSIVNVSGSVVQIFTAKSQSRRAMSKKDFESSKADVIGFVTNLIGISPEELRRNAGKAE
jgi:hypothetical protein